jgi:hypothetical protein
MKRRVAPIITFTIAIVLAGSLAYAAKKKIQDKSVPRASETSEEESLKVELLNATEDPDNKLPGTGESPKKKIVPVTGDENTKDPIAKPPKK